MSSRYPEKARRAAHRATAVAVLLAAALAATGDAPGAAAAAVLRVCADPNNLPFSNARGEGFENRIADLLARDRGAVVRYTWWAQRRGFFRNTLAAGTCDVVLGVPAGFDRVLATAPYYRSSYVFVIRHDRGPPPRSLDDPALRAARIGVQLIGDDYANAPPAHALARRGLVANVVGYPLYGDYAQDSPPARIVEAVARGDVDVAIVWGPLAGFFARRQNVALDLAPVPPDPAAPFLPFAFDIAVGVRRADRALRDEIEDVLRRRRAEVESILDAYGVPRLRRDAAPS
jgi:mxaJ protein